MKVKIMTSEDWDYYWFSHHKPVGYTAEFDRQKALIYKRLKLSSNGMKRVLEAGCGYGRWLVELSNNKHYVVGVDFSSIALEQAHRNIVAHCTQPDKIKLLQGDVRNIPVKDNVFDATLSLGVIEHFEESEKATRELFRVLRPGGRALISVPNRWSLTALPSHIRGSYTQKYYKPKIIRDLLSKCGFKIILISGLSIMPMYGFPWGYLPRFLQSYLYPAIVLANFIERIETPLNYLGHMIFTIGEKP